MRRLVPTMAAYVVILLAARWAAERWQPEGALQVVLAILPALPVVVVMVVMGLYLGEERDEYLKQRVAMAMLIGTGFLISVATVWGFLEDGGIVPHLPAYWAFMLWCLGMGVAQCVMALGDRWASPR
jgi:cytochrome P450